MTSSAELCRSGGDACKWSAGEHATGAHRGHGAVRQRGQCSYRRPARGGSQGYA